MQEISYFKRACVRVQVSMNAGQPEKPERGYKLRWREIKRNVHR